jgi:hypothetical protein
MLVELAAKLTSPLQAAVMLCVPMPSVEIVRTARALPPLLLSWMVPSTWLSFDQRK